MTALALALGSSPTGCQRSFVCRDDSECRNRSGNGFCEAERYCSFPDESCPSGRRYGEHAPLELERECVDDASGDSGTPPQGWLMGYAARRTLTVLGERVPVATSNAVLFVDLGALSSGQVRPHADLRDVRFVTKDGALPVAHETVSGGAWVAIGLVEPGVDRELFVYYGDPDAASASAPEVVWADYAGVWHLDETTAGLTRNSIRDSAHGVASESRQEDGVLGGSLVFDGQSGHVNVSGDPELAVGQPLTISMWARPDAFVEAALLVGSMGVDVGLDAAIEEGEGLFIGRAYRLATPEWPQYAVYGTTGELQVGTWSFVTLVVDGLDLALYVDGAASGTATLGQGGEPELPTGAFIGQSGFDYNPEFFPGAVDEVRVRAGAATANEVFIEHDVQRNASEYIDLGDEERP